MKRVTFNDFSGGIAADGVILNDRQVADAHGFVLDDQRRLRSQPPIDELTRILPTELSKFVVGGVTWLLVKSSSLAGTSFSYVKLDETHGKQAPTAGMIPVTWQVLAGTFAEAHRIVGQIRYNDDNKLKPALLIHVPPQGGVMSVAEAKAYYVVQSDDGQSLRTIEVSNFYPSLTFRDNEYFAESPAVPRCSVVTMWRDVPVYANIEYPGAQSNDWFKDGSFTASSAKMHSNFVYFGDPVNNGWVDPRYPHRVSDEGTTIIGMFEIDEGLLCFTTGSSNASGVILLRGTPADFTVDAADKASNERITGLAPMQVRSGTDTSILTRSMSYWDEQQSVLFVTEDNRLMQYRTGRLADISPQTAALPPLAGRLGATTASVAAAGRYVVFADSRQQTMWIMRSFGTEGAWTRLLMPEGEPAFGSLVEAGGDLYWAHHVDQGGVRSLIKLCVLRLTDPPAVDQAGVAIAATMPAVLVAKQGAASRRGEILGALSQLRVVTRAFGEDTPTVEKWWDRVSVRVLRASPTAARVVSITTTVQDAEQNLVTYTETVNDDITRPAETVVVNSAGPAAVAQISIAVTGDLIIDAVSIEYAPGLETL